MRVGDVVSASSIVHVQDGGDTRLTFKHPDKKKVFVFMLLGEELKDGSAPLNLNEVMDKLGWREK